MPTPVRVRGKSGNKRLVISSRTDDKSEIDHDPKAITKARQLSRLEQLPTELIHEIFWHSLNLDLAQASPILASRLNGTSFRRLLVSYCFFECTWRSTHHRVAESSVYTMTTKTSNSRIRKTTFQTWPIPWRKERDQLRYSVLRKTWFTARFLLTCQKYFLQAMVPLPLQRNLDLGLSMMTINRSMVPELIRKNAPFLLQEMQRPIDQEEVASASKETIVVASRPRDMRYQPFYLGEYKVSLRKVGYFGSALVQHHIWNIYQDDTKDHTLLLSCDLPSKYVHEHVPAHLFDLASWTMDDVTLLRLMSYERVVFEFSSNETAAAISNGLMTAIRQKFVPAVFTLAKPWWYPEVSAKCQRYGYSFVLQIINDSKSREDPSTGTSWIRYWRNDLRRLWPDQYHLQKKGDLVPYNPSSTSHILAAMESAIKNPLSDDVWNIFRWVSLSFAINMINNREDFPEELLQQTQQIALEDTGSSKVGNRCYEFLSQVVTKLWEMRAYGWESVTWFYRDGHDANSDNEFDPEYEYREESVHRAELSDEEEGYYYDDEDDSNRVVDYPS